MVGGGEGAFIGAVHRIAARIDDHYELVAGALSSTPEKARRSGEALGLAPDRIYDDLREHGEGGGQAPRRDRGGLHRDAEPRARRGRPTPSSKAGIHVICDKPLTVTLWRRRKSCGLPSRSRAASSR